MPQPSVPQSFVPKPYIVDIHGVFVGLAVPQPGGFRFVAMDVRLDELDGSVWVTLPALQQHIACVQDYPPGEAIAGCHAVSHK